MLGVFTERGGDVGDDGAFGGTDGAMQAKQTAGDFGDVDTQVDELAFLVSLTGFAAVEDVAQGFAAVSYTHLDVYKRQSLVCNGGVCAVPTCTDIAKNAKETDVDCGGGTCGPCDDLKSCGMPGDCKSNVCICLLYTSRCV